MLRLFVTFIALIALGKVGYSQEAGIETVPEVTESEIQTVLDPSPFLSARASGLGGAMSTLTDGTEAVYYNPAGIGGLHLGTRKPKTLRNLHFPYAGASANENATKLRSEFSSQGGAEDRGVGQAIIDANEGKRQFGRASLLLDLTLSRTTYIAYSDVQFAAVKSSGVDASEGEISMKYRSLSGTGIGFSVTDPKERFYFGSFTGYNSMSLTEVEGASYLDIINVDSRKQLLKDNSTKWTGTSTNVGLIWVFSKMWRPSLGIVARDVGGSIYKSDSPIVDGSASSLIIQQDLTAGFSVSPKIGKDGAFNFILEGHDLTDANTTLKKKVRIGMELNLGGFGSNSNFGVRAGYNGAGTSFGTNINIGLVQLEFASEAIDIGIDNRVLVEKRSVAIFSVNMAND